MVMYSQVQPEQAGELSSVELETLADRLETDSIPAEEALSIFRVLLVHLAQLHSTVAELTDQLGLSEQRLDRYQYEFGPIDERL